MKHYINLEKARIGLTPKKISVTRGGKTFDMTVYTREISNYKTTKGTNSKVNAEMVVKSGVRIKVSEEYRKVLEEAVAHVANEGQLLPYMKGLKIETANLGNRHGTMKGGLYIDEKSLKEKGPGFVAAIIRHELEHKILSAKKVPSSDQERKVRYTTGMWASLKYSMMVKTNPIAAKGFKEAANDQGVRIR